jgi:hypothetical protein
MSIYLDTWIEMVRIILSAYDLPGPLPHIYQFSVSDHTIFCWYFSNFVLFVIRSSSHSSTFINYSNASLDIRLMDIER